MRPRVNFVCPPRPFHRALTPFVETDLKFNPSLAYAELKLIFSVLFRMFKITNAGTTLQDMEWYDRFVPVSRGPLKVKLATQAD